MKKYLILLIIPLLFFFTGCEEDQDLSEVTTGDITNSVSLDSELFGVWCTTEEDMYDYNQGTILISPYDCRSYSSNGKFVMFDYIGTPENPQSIDQTSGGDWWVQDGYLYTNLNNNDSFSVTSYNILDNTLTTYNSIPTNTFPYDEEIVEYIFIKQ